jgi:hypothetical protein
MIRNGKRHPFSCRRRHHPYPQVPDMSAVARALVDRLQAKHAATGEAVNMFSTLKLATLDTIGLTAFGCALP